MSHTFAGFQLSEVHGVPLLWLPDRRFKTFRVQFVARRSLDHRAAARSLLPGLLLQGTVHDPDRPAIARRMEMLHGATVVPGTTKHGESHLLQLVLDTVAGEFLPSHPDQLADGLSLLADLGLRPRLEGSGFPPGIFALEKAQALDALRTLSEDKAAHAQRRAIELACSSEPYGIHEDGGQEAIAALGPADPELARIDFLKHGEVVMLAMGALPEQGFEQRVGEFLAGMPARTPEPVADPVSIAPRPVVRVVERTVLQQSRLVLVHRVPWTRDEDIWTARLLAVNLLGGGPHSRLFKEVREKRSLAYSVHAQMDPSKGVMMVHAGLDEAAASAVEEQTAVQLAALAAGAFTDEELDTARAGVLSALQQLEDGIGPRLDFTLRRFLHGLDRTPEDTAERYRRATRTQVAAAAKELWLDHVVLVAGEESTS